MRGIHPAVYDADFGLGQPREGFLDGVRMNEGLSPELVRPFAREESGRRGRLDRCRENYRETSWEGFRKLTLGRLRKELRREVGAVGNGNFVRVAGKFPHFGGHVVSRHPFPNRVQAFGRPETQLRGGSGPNGLFGGADGGVLLRRVGNPNLIRDIQVAGSRAELPHFLDASLPVGFRMLRVCGNHGSVQ